MTSQIKKLGDYIEQTNIKNTKLEVLNLLGVSIDKKFINSHANTVGTDFSAYKILKKGQFAYCPVTSRNGDKISVALLKECDNCLISSSYIPFRIIDTSQLIPEFLMLLFSNPEFDRYARYNSWGSAREVFSWEELCDTNILVPNYEKQLKIIQGVHLIEKRVNELSIINNILDKEIDTIYKKHFSNKKKTIKLVEKLNPVLGGTPSTENKEYWNGNIGWINSGEINNFRITKPTTYITNKGLQSSSTKLMPRHTVVIAITGATLGQESILLMDCCGNQSVIGIPETEEYPYEYIHPMIKESMFELLKNQTGGAQSHINKDDVKAISIHSVTHSEMLSFIKDVRKIYEYIECNCYEIEELQLLKSRIISSV